MNHDYQELISEVSEQTAEKFSEKEEDTAARAVFSDTDISEITRQIGPETTEIVLGNTCDRLVKKNRRKD